VLGAAPPCAEQDDGVATYAEKITPADRELDPQRTAIELERVVRALTPHIGAYAVQADGERLGVLAAHALDADTPAPGVLALEGPRPVLGCAEGALELTVVQPPGRRPMNGEAYLRGLRP
jgi:methionyl-tRNA formyltransferase